MSATLNQKIVSMLDIPEGQYEWLEMPSTFPVENSPHHPRQDGRPLEPQVK